MKVVTVKTGDPQIAVSCLGGCLLLIAWIVVGVINVTLSIKLQLEGWQAAIIGIVWVLSGPVVGVAYLKWRGSRHAKAFRALEDKMTQKVMGRLRRRSPDP